MWKPYNTPIVIILLLFISIFAFFLIDFKKHTLTDKIISGIGVITDYIEIPDNSFPHEYTIKLDTIFLGNNTQSNRQKLVIKTKEKADVDVGDAVFIEQMHVKPFRSQEQALFYWRNNRLATVYQEQFTGKLIDRPSWSFNRFLVTRRNKLISELRSKLSPPAFALYTTLFFGRKLGLYETHDEQYQLFQNWGIVHYLARSGLHVALLVSLWRYVIFILPLPFAIKELILLLCIIFYSFISWGSISFLRAFCMFAFHWYCRVNLRASHGLYILL